jgi:hypothetical protein
MSGTTAQRRAAQAIENDDDTISPEGTCSAREAGSSVYGLIPAEKAKAHGVEQGTELIVGYHPPTSTVLLTPAHLAPDWADGLD